MHHYITKLLSHFNVQQFNDQCVVPHTAATIKLEESTMGEAIGESHDEIKDSLRSTMHSKLIEGKECNEEGQKEDHDAAEFEVEVLIGTFHVLEFKVSCIAAMNTETIFRMGFNYSVIGHRKTLVGHVEMLVKWKGYGEEEATWEPIENVHPDLLVEYFLHKMEMIKHQKGGVALSRDSKSEKDYSRFRAGLRSISRKLRQTEKVCEDLRNQNEDLQRTINQLVDENEAIKKQSKETSSSKSRKHSAKEIEILRKVYYFINVP